MTDREARYFRSLIDRVANEAPDETAVECKELYYEWKPDTQYRTGKRVRYGGYLYEIVQEHTSQSIYPPSIATSSLYKQIPEAGQGLSDRNPIPYDGNMELVEGMYYSQSGVVYLCTRSTGVPVYNNLTDLVNIYVEVVRG